MAMVPDKLALGNEGLVSHDANRSSRRASPRFGLGDAKWRCAENAEAKGHDCVMAEAMHHFWPCLSQQL
jgi:hypothetical protein